MTRPTKLPSSEVDTWLRAHEGWAREGDGLVKGFTFQDFAAALSFVVRLGLLAEKKDHHPDIALGYGKARVLFTTHDAGGITSLDLALAEGADLIPGSHPA